MPEIFLIRHGETHWNRAKRVQGHADSPLTLKGIEQAKAYGLRLRSLLSDPEDWTLVSSPLPRCRQTSAIICETAGLDFAAIVYDDRLKEVFTGAYGGMLKSDIPPSLLTGSGVQQWVFRCPGGETHGQLAARLSAWLGDRQPGEKLAVVSHGIAGKVLRGLYLRQGADAALGEDSPQNAFFHLKDGAVTRLAC